MHWYKKTHFTQYVTCEEYLTYADMSELIAFWAANLTLYALHALESMGLQKSENRQKGGV